MSMKLYVGNLAFQTSSEDLQQLFAQAGTVESASVVEDRETGRSRGFGFVEMSSKEEGEKAIEQFNGKDFGGRNLTVNEAKPRENRAGGGGGRGGYGGGGGGRGGGGGGRSGGGGGYGGGGGRGGGGGGRGGSGGGGGDREPRW
jgi:RNA recognition motif-containing protein